MLPDTFTRRRILAAVGSVGALYLGADQAGAMLGLDPVDMNQRTVNGTYAAPTHANFENAPPHIALVWRETVNGDVQETTDLTTDGETDGVGLIVDEAVLPGDSGSVTMRARLLEDPEQKTDVAQLYLLFRLSDTAENDINEPERGAGDTSETDGELDDFTQITVWKDDSPMGTGDGEWDGIPIVGDTEIASGSLTEVATEVGDGYQLSIDGSTCLDPANEPEVYVSFEWQIPEDVGNIIQGDSATFQVAFDPRPCPGEGV
ncbi:MAG: hypothetical protein ABEJ73_06930 [Haloplanus sp.]